MFYLTRFHLTAQIILVLSILAVIKSEQNLEYGSIKIIQNKQNFQVNFSTLNYLDDSKKIIHEDVGVQLRLWCISSQSIKWTTTGKIVSRFDGVSNTRQMSNCSLIDQQIASRLLLVLGEESTGIYRCEHVDDPTEGINFYIYVNNQKDKTVTSLKEGIPLDSMYLPCMAQNYNETPTLFKFPNFTSPVVLPYEPLVGFELQDELKPNDRFLCLFKHHSTVLEIEDIPEFRAEPPNNIVYGFPDETISLRCSSSSGGLNFTHNLVDDTDIQFVYSKHDTSVEVIFTMPRQNVSVTCSNKKSSHTWFIMSDQKALIKYYPLRDKVQCHATDRDNTQIVNYFCENENDCEIKRSCFLDGSCSYWLNHGLNCQYDSCVEINHPFHTGIIRCINNAIQVEKMYFTGLDRRIYFLDEPIPDEAMVKLEFDETFYMGQNKMLNISCSYVRFMFSNSAVFAVQYRNNSIIQLEDGSENFSEDYDTIQTKSLRDVTVTAGFFSPTLDVVSISCLVPFQRKSEWFTIAKEITVTGNPHYNKL